MAAPGAITVQVVHNREMLESVYRLRHDAYVRKRYIAPRSSGMMSDGWDELSTTMHFVALQKDCVIGAVRLVLDSANGLPMERVFPDEVRQLRGQGRRLAEASTMAVSHPHQESDCRLWLRLSRVLWQRAGMLQVDDLCLAVTPNHLAFYERLLFEPMGSPRRYGSLNGILAYPLRLQAQQARVRHTSSNDRPAAPLREFLLDHPQ
jgi:predicted GNAT family N-acyltransferase